MKILRIIASLCLLSIAALIADIGLPIHKDCGVKLFCSHMGWFNFWTIVNLIIVIALVFLAIWNARRAKRIIS
jgi:hypothetical protein